MTTGATITDEDLTAFLDGEADADLIAQIERVRRDDPAVSARLDALALDKTGLAAAFDGTLGAAPGAPAFLTEERRPSFQAGYWRHAVAAVCLLAVGWGAGVASRDDAPATWRDYAATYHALYVAETLETADRDPAVLAAQLARVSAALGKPLSIDALSGVPGFDLRRAQILAFNDAPLIQVAFLADGDVPMALCLFRKPGPAKPVAAGERMGMASADWSDGEIGYLLIGGNDVAVLERAAESFANRL